MAAEIVAALRDGRLATARVEEAAGRADALAAWTRAGTAAEITASDLGYAAARRAVRVEGVLDRPGQPARGAAASPPRRSPRGGCRGASAPHLDGAEQLPRGRRRDGPGNPGASWPRGRPIVLVGRHVHRLPGAAELIEALAVEHPVTVVEMGWPSTWRPAGVRAFVTTYGASHANGRAAADALGLAG